MNDNISIAEMAFGDKKCCNANTSKKDNKSYEIAHPELFKKIEQYIDIYTRPYIQSDGGDIELLGIDEHKNLFVKLHGACVGCPSAHITLYQGVQSQLDSQFPDENIKLLQVE